MSPRMADPHPPKRQDFTDPSSKVDPSHRRAILQSSQMSGSHLANTTMGCGFPVLPQGGSVLGSLSFKDEFSISMGNELSGMSPAVIKKPTI